MPQRTFGSKMERTTVCGFPRYNGISLDRSLKNSFRRVAISEG
jgi:hypothetical protein